MRRLCKKFFFFIVNVFFLIIITLILYKCIEKKVSKENEIHILEIIGKEEFIIENNEEWNYKNPDILINEKGLLNFQKKYGLDLQRINFNNNESYIISFGKPILVIYYQQKNKNEWSYDVPHANAFFDDSFYENTIFVYRVNNPNGIWSFGLP